MRFKKSQLEKYINTFYILLTIVLFPSCKGGGNASAPPAPVMPQFALSSIYINTGNSIGNIDVSSILAANNNDIFIGIKGYNDNEVGIGLYKSSNGGISYSKYDSGNGLLFDSINDIAEGPGGIIYTTHYYINYGVALLGYSQSTDSTATSFTNVVTPLNTKDKISIQVNSSGHIFVAGNRTERSTNNGTSFVNIGASNQDNKVWVGKTTNRIYVYNGSAPGLQISSDNGNTFSSVGVAQGLAGNRVVGVKEDSAGNIYVVSIRTDEVSPGGLAVSTNGGVSFVQRPLPLNLTKDRSIYDISINSTNTLCLIHRFGYSCSKDTGYTWHTESLVSADKKIALTNNNILIVSDYGAPVHVHVSNGILPTGMGTAFTGGILPSEKKLSNLPIGTYTRSLSRIHTYADSGANTSVMEITANTTSTKLISSQVLAADSLNSVYHTYARFTKNIDGSVDWKDQVAITGNIAAGNVYSGSVVVSSVGTDNQSAADIVTEENAAKDAAAFVEYRWLSTNVLRRTIFIELAGGIRPNWYIYEDYDYTP